MRIILKLLFYFLKKKSLRDRTTEFRVSCANPDRGSDTKRAELVTKFSDITEKIIPFFPFGRGATCRVGRRLKYKIRGVKYKSFQD